MTKLFDSFIQLILDAIKFRYHRKPVLVVYAVITVLIFYFIFMGAAVAPVIETTAHIPEVQIQSVRSLSSGAVFSAVGTVEAVSEARLQVEAGGRITAVNANLGQNVTVGTIIARVENASEAAALLQAQGAYEAAQAGVMSSRIGIKQAENVLLAAQNSAISADRIAYSTISDAFYSKINNVIDDPIISSPVIIFINSKIPFLWGESHAFEKILPDWKVTATDLSIAGDLDSTLSKDILKVKRVITMVDNIISVLNDSYKTRIVAGVTVDTQISLFTGLRSSLNSTLASLEAAEVGLRNARETQKQAALNGGDSSDISLANAQVKIALGSLRAAQANYEKTIVRSPITGVINALYLKVGDYVNPGQAAAIVANNNGLEINTAVSYEESIKLATNDSVRIGDTATGTISAIAGAVDPTTGKVALRIAVPNNNHLQNGSTVSIEFNTDGEQNITEISIPLSAIKLTGNGPVVFTVSDTEKSLTEIPVELGAINGENVIIPNGLTLDAKIVVDARGLKSDEMVEVIYK